MLQLQKSRATHQQLRAHTTAEKQIQQALPAPSHVLGMIWESVTQQTNSRGNGRRENLHRHVVVLAALVLPELLLPLLDGHVLQEVCIPLSLRALEAQLAEEGHHLHPVKPCHAQLGVGGGGDNGVISKMQSESASCDAGAKAEIVGMMQNMMEAQ